ncbi:protein of unknown function [Candidatus Nitrospira inopinata]|jgi:hypothetical protein|uniref:Uncharacterized protein n=1 Tax=Candidatus Nitrospira inopinata TaxID=1715989 RepID=A0A0S4L1U5_9BACT|nr:protein of unknown function [Candidatus Nitrospira inopinata]
MLEAEQFGNALNSLVSETRTYLKIETRSPERAQTRDTEQPTRVFSAKCDPFRCVWLRL